MGIALIILSIIIIELNWKPRLDKTSEGNLLLWYNNDDFSGRKYLKIY